MLKLHIAPAPRKRPKTARAAFDIAKLKKGVLCKSFQDTLDANIQNATLAEDSTEKWDQFKNVVNETAKSILGPKQPIHQDWFDDNDEQITQLLQEKNNAFIPRHNDHSLHAKKDLYKHLKKQAQRKLREMKDTWWDRKAEEVQMCADTHNSKKFFSALKAVYGPTKPESTPLQSVDGSMLIKDQEGLRNRLAEHFSTLPKRPSTVDPTALEQVPQQPTLNDLDLPPSVDELSKVLKQTNSGRTSGKDDIPAEIYKVAGPRAMEVYLDIIQSIWDQEKMPENFRDALIVALYKNKGSKADCGHYRGIFLLSIAGKIFAHIALNRLVAFSEVNPPEAQRGFRPGYSTVDMIFTVR